MLDLTTAYSEAAEVHGVHTLKLANGCDVPFSSDSGFSDKWGDRYFAVLNKPVGSAKARQRMYSIDKLEQVTQAARNCPDTYYSQASFVSPKTRSIATVSHIGCSFVDIDCYKMGMEADTATVEKLLERAQSIGLTLPSYVVSSGRGVYLKWLFNSPLYVTQIDRWTKLQQILIPLFRSLGSDSMVRDPARVLRVVQSTNSKADNAVVRVLWNSGQRVEFEDLFRSTCALNFDALKDSLGLTDGDLVSAGARPKGKGRTKKAGAFAEQSDLGGIVEGLDRDITQARLDNLANLAADAHALNTDVRLIKSRIKRAEIASMPEAQQEAFLAQSRTLMTDFSAAHEPIMLNAATRTLNSLNFARFIDLRDLCLMRGGPRRGSRDVVLFWMMNFLGLSGAIGSQNLYTEVSTLIRGFEGVFEDFDPIADGSLSTLLERMRMREQGLKVSFNGFSYDALYTPTNEHLLDLFDISEAEQRRLSTIISEAEKLRRADEKVPGRSDRRQNRQQSRALAIEIWTKAHANRHTDDRQDGQATQTNDSGTDSSPRLTIAALAQQLNISRHQAGRWIRQAQADKIRAAGKSAESASADSSERVAFASSAPHSGAQIIEWPGSIKLAVDQDVKAGPRTECAVFSLSKGERGEAGDEAHQKMLTSLNFEYISLCKQKDFENKIAREEKISAPGDQACARSSVEGLEGRVELDAELDAAFDRDLGADARHEVKPDSSESNLIHFASISVWKRNLVLDESVTRGMTSESANMVRQATIRKGLDLHDGHAEPVNSDSADFARAALPKSAAAKAWDAMRQQSELVALANEEMSRKERMDRLQVMREQLNRWQSMARGNRVDRVDHVVVPLAGSGDLAGCSTQDFAGTSNFESEPNSAFDQVEDVCPMNDTPLESDEQEAMERPRER